MTDLVIQQVETWLDDVVIGLNLCPFAAKPKRQNQIHIDVYDGSEADLMKHLITALTELDHYPAKTRDTTLIVLSNCLQSFDDYNQFLGDVDWVIERGEEIGRVFTKWPASTLIISLLIHIRKTQRT